MYNKTRVCKDCDDTIVYNSRQAYWTANKHNSSCRSCSQTRANNPRWKGGVITHSSGYRQILQGYNTYKMEHRIIFEKHLGRLLLPDEVVHHEDEIRDNNDITNLILFNNTGDHRKWHGGNKKVEHIKGKDLK